MSVKADSQAKSIVKTILLILTFTTGLILLHSKFVAYRERSFLLPEK